MELPGSSGTVPINCRKAEAITTGRAGDFHDNNKKTADAFLRLPSFFCVVLQIAGNLLAGSALSFGFRELSSHQHAHAGGHHQAARPAARIAEAMQVPDARVEIFVHFDAVAVELQLRRIEQRFHCGEAGHHVVHGLDEMDDIDHRAVRHCGGDVARHGVGQGGLQVRARKLLLPSALAVENISVALDKNMPCAEHVRQLSDLLRVFDRLVERLVEVV